MSDMPDNAKFFHWPKTALRDKCIDLNNENHALTAERDALRAEVERLRGYLESMADPRDFHGFAVPYNAPGAGAQFVKLAQEALKGETDNGK